MKFNERMALLPAGGLLLVLLAIGCRAVRSATQAPVQAVYTVIQTAADAPGQAVRAVLPQEPQVPVVNPVEVQQSLMRFANAFTARMTSSIEKLQQGTNALNRTGSLRWNLAFGTAACAIASGENAVASMLNMTVFVMETRMAVEDHWMPNVFGEAAGTLLENCRTSEAEIWRLVATVLQPEQQVELREAIEAWHRQHAAPTDLPMARAAGLALDVAQNIQTDGSTRGSLLGLLRLDPLSGLDPARRELAEARLFAERALFVVQVLPTLLRWQAELLSLEMLNQPAVQQWTTNATQIAASVERLTAAAEQLPGQLAAEREEILRTLESQERILLPVLGEARLMLTAGAQMSDSLNVTLATFDGVLKRLGIDEAAGPRPAKTNSEPFRIQNYGQAAERLEAAARQFTELLRTFDQTLGANSRSQLAAQLGPVVQQARTDGQDLVDHAFRKGVLFVVVVLLAALIYRVLAARLTRAAPDR
jgi:hypothetical protein